MTINKHNELLLRLSAFEVCNRAIQMAVIPYGGYRKFVFIESDYKNSVLQALDLYKKDGNATACAKQCQQWIEAYDYIHRCLNCDGQGVVGNSYIFDDVEQKDNCPICNESWSPS